ncbi:PAS domain-containing protein (plasmid) [Lichenicola cladoniae]|uniref:histidine kinase n=1 Tax=Lichenicola cladoniae TaxID=1484109 RepID=A0A6M8HX67_9PROT|nr:sensor histidine kinase [Lichenicola cladoniae]NPD68997.1 PAS domain-containing protein [Acetobacteraceae bacterium]QKE92992.1 PAS domain-containing protein [Lichenicola cladoniae]
MLWSGSGDLVWDAERRRIATDAAGVALWSWNFDTDEIALDERAQTLWGVSSNRAVTFETLSARIHPEDLDRVKTVFTATHKMTGAYEIDFRILLDDSIRWILARGQSEDVGIVNRVMFGVFLDVSDRKQAEEKHEMLAGEMNHRVKNLFALASALTSLAARSTETKAEMAEDLTERLAALGRAHSLVRPGPGQENKALLAELLAVLLAPYDDQTTISRRLRISVPELPVGEASATTLALVVHELATNSVKYGALSAASGTLDVSCTDEDSDLVMLWTERGGPPLDPCQRPKGFGSKLIARSISFQLGGSITYDWPPQGAVVTLRISKTCLAR